MKFIRLNKSFYISYLFLFAARFFFSPHFFLYASEKISVSLTHPHHKALNKNKGALKLMGEIAAEIDAAPQGTTRSSVLRRRAFFLFIKELKQMAEKQINGRVLLKHDSEANWAKATNFIPKAGEAIIYDPDGTHTEPRIKIGDGVNVVGSLPFFVPYLTNDEIDEICGSAIFEGSEVSY